MDWIQTLKDLWWLVASVLILLGYFWKTAVKANKSKEQIAQVEVNKKAIEALQTEMVNIKGDITEIKDGVDRQGQDTVAILSSLQSIMNALYDSDCNIGPARDKFNDYLTKR
jgi:hypothetical protein